MTIIQYLPATLIGALLAGAAVGQVPPRPTDWPEYGYDMGGGRFSPLRQITPKNVGKLQLAWTYHLNPEQGKKSLLYATTTPLIVGGKMFVGNPYNSVVALDPTTGKELWKYTLPPNDQPAQRGLAYWAGDASHAPRLIFGTLLGRIIALDAVTGAAAAGFGIDGIVDSRTPEILNGIPAAQYRYSAPPAIYRNLAIFGSAVQESPSRGASGDVRAWDIITGKLAWTFHSIPRPGEPFHETWTDDGWQQRSGVNVWNMITVDAERGLAYLPFGAPAFDRYGGDHKGANLFSNSLVAVDAATGKYVWHFQTVHHDIWDYDLHVPPTLLTVRKDGRDIPAIVAMNKTALLFLLDRTTGKPIFDVNEIPVPPSTVAGEQAWPTQPFPTRPGIVTRMSFDMSELAHITPEHTAACQAMIAKEPPAGTKMFEPLRADRPSIRFPGGAGGPEWGGGAFDPTTGLFVFASNQVGYLEKLVKQPDGEWYMTSARFWDDATRSPCHVPPWGELIAIDVNKGRVAWRKTVGITDSFPPGKQQTGRPGNGGPIMTASGLIFVAGTDDHRIRAFESRTGKELWTYDVQYAAHATPATYQGADGRQYVAIVATGGSFLRSPLGGDSLMVFALPR